MLIFSPLMPGTFGANSLRAEPKFFPMMFVETIFLMTALQIW